MLALLLMAAFPVLELILRSFFNTGITGSAEFVQHLTLWVGFLGAAMASRENRHLSLSSGITIVPEKYTPMTKAFSGIISTAVASALTWASYQFVVFELESDALVGSLFPVWIIELILPLSFALITLRFIWNAGPPSTACERSTTRYAPSRCRTTRPCA